jgi:hypothetical protein
VSNDTVLETPYPDEEYRRRLESDIKREREKRQSHERRVGLRFQTVQEWLNYSDDIVFLHNNEHFKGY